MITSGRSNCCLRRNWRRRWCRCRQCRRRGSRAGAEGLVAHSTELERVVSLSLPTLVAFSVLFLTRSAQEIALQANVFLTMEAESLASVRHIFCVSTGTEYRTLGIGIDPAHLGHITEIMGEIPRCGPPTEINRSDKHVLKQQVDMATGITYCKFLSVCVLF